MSDRIFTCLALGLAICFFVGILFCVELGWRLGHKQTKIKDDESLEGTKTIEAALLGLLGLLVAFTFSGAASRFDSRRLLVIQETNLIGTAYLRLDLLPTSIGLEVKKMMRDYLDLRIETFRNLSNPEIRAEKMAATQTLQKQIWQRTMVGLRQDSIGPSAMLILPVLNDVFDITTTRSMWTLMHPPMVILVLLIVIGLACSLVAGYSMVKEKSRRWVHIFGFAFVLTFTFYVILDLEFPRLGFIRVDSFDNAMVALRASLN